MRRKWRVIAGFLIAPLVPTLAVSVSALFTDGPNSAVLFFLIGILYGYPVALIVGGPLHLMFASRGWTGPLAYVIAGVFLGSVSYGLSFVAAVVFGGKTIAELKPTFSPGLALASAIAGLIAALTFWFIARPDRASGGNGA